MNFIDTLAKFQIITIAGNLGHKFLFKIQKFREYYKSCYSSHAIVALHSSCLSHDREEHIGSWTQGKEIISQLNFPDLCKF